MSDIGLFEAMYSARALRRLKPDPVPDELIRKILDAAIRAPSAGNSQHWAFVVVRDSEMRRKLGSIYRKGSDIAKAIYQARGRPVHMTDEQYQRMMSSGAYLWEHMGDAPVLLVPCLRDRPPPAREALPPAVQAIYKQELVHRTDSRRQHLSRRAEYHFGLPRLRPRHIDHDKSHPLRGRSQSFAGNTERCVHLCADAHRLSGE